MTSLNAEENKSPDPETLLQCPYDKNHQIRACRFPYHLVKCRKNNQTVAKQLVACPYNARHRIPKEEFNSHIETCENKVSIEPCEAAANKRLKEGNKEKTAWQCPPPKEDWEADAEEAPARPFVFGASITRKETYNPVLFSNAGGHPSPQTAVKAVQQWNTLPRSVVEAPFWEDFKQRLDSHLSGMPGNRTKRIQD